MNTLNEQNMLTLVSPDGQFRMIVTYGLMRMTGPDGEAVAAWCCSEDETLTQCDRPHVYRGQDRDALLKAVEVGAIRHVRMHAQESVGIN